MKKKKPSAVLNQAQGTEGCMTERMQRMVIVCAVWLVVAWQVAASAEGAPTPRIGAGIFVQFGCIGMRL